MILKHMQKPISDTGKSEAKLYLSKLKDNRYKIKKLVDCFLKWTRDQSTSSEGKPDSKRQDRWSSLSSTWTGYDDTRVTKPDQFLDTERGN